MVENEGQRRRIRNRYLILCGIREYELYRKNLVVKGGDLPVN